MIAGYDTLQYIVSRLQQLNCLRWNVTLHSFEDSTPLGVKPFTNLIATLDPHVDKRLVLAAHYDSKLIPPQDGKEFLGATDSALPVALLLDLALTLDEKLQNREVRPPHAHTVTRCAPCSTPTIHYKSFSLMVKRPLKDGLTRILSMDRASWQRSCPSAVGFLALPAGQGSMPW